MKHINKKFFFIITFCLIFIATLVFTYIYISNENLHKNTKHYNVILKNSLIEIDSKNKNINVETFVFDKLNDPLLVPYIDKTKAKLKRQINVVVNSLDNKTQSTALEIFDFASNVNVKKIYDYMENKKQFKIDEQKNKLIFINLIGPNEEKIRKIIIKNLQNYNEFYK